MDHPNVQKIKAQFESLAGWEERYRKIIDLGKSLETMPEAMKTEDNKVKGCQSQVWLFAEMDTDRKIHFWGDSDALIVRGLVSVLLGVYNGLTPKEIMEISPDFLKDLGFDKNLSPSRTNGLFSMLKQIRMYATAFSYKT